MYAFELQDDKGTGMQSTYILKEIETKLSDAMTGARNVLKTEGNLMRKSILRRGASLYTAVKRIKGNKKSRPTLARRKNHCVNSNAENSAIICAIRSEVERKSFLNTIDHYRSNKSNGSVINEHEPRLNTHTYANKKLTDNSTKMHVSSEETAMVKHGAKRLKIISRISKALPEIGESSCNIEETGTKVSLKMSCACDKQSVKGIRDKVRIGGRYMKPNRSSKLKEMKTAIKLQSSALSIKQNLK